MTTKRENLETESFAEANKAASIPHCGFGRNRPALAGLGGLPRTDDNRMLCVAEFCHRYAIGKTMAYAEMAAGRLRYCQHGKRRLIHVDDAEAWGVSTRQPQPPCGPDSSNRGAQ
jgi:hypothetical protein